MQTNASQPDRVRMMRLLIIVLIVISTILFVTGVIIERGRGESGQAQAAASAQPTAAGSQEGQESNESGEVKTPTPSGNVEGSSEAGEATHTEASGESAQTTQGTPSKEGETGGESHKDTETVLGIDIENPWIVGGIVVGWLALIAGLFLLGRVGLILVAAAAVLSLIFDVAEVAFQFGMSDTLVGVIALLVVALHAAIAVLAVWALMRGGAQVSPPPPTPTGAPG